MSDIELITTADGSHSLLNTKLNETYHSVHGAIQESVHVFIRNGLEFMHSSLPPVEIRILEMGFGTGLNALLTLQCALDLDLRIHYTTLEAFPLEEATWSQLNYPTLLDSESTAMHFRQLHTTRWEQEEVILSNFTIVKKLIKMQEWNPGPAQFDLIYFDAFAPVKQPEMWELPVLKKLEWAMKPGAIFVTYCARGQLKRDLKSIGLRVETLPGPPGKKEMVRATKS